MITIITNALKSPGQRLTASWPRVLLFFAGAAALLWFLIRVIPKPSRAGYPCQRAAFPLASSFVLALVGLLTTHFVAKRLRQILAEHRAIAMTVGVAGLFALSVCWTILTTGTGMAAGEGETKTPGSKFPSKYPVTSKYDWTPGPANQPIGNAQGIFPGRVVWARDPLATKWAGRWKLNEDQWWTDANTDQQHVDGLMSVVLRQLTSATTDAAAWQAIFQHYNTQKRQLPQRGYQAGEVVALKINLNNSEKPTRVDNLTDASPQMVLAMVRQLVNEAHVPQDCIVVYEARRFMMAAIMEKIWAEFKDVRFVQQDAPEASQPVNPAYGDHHGLESANWVEGISYSDGGKYDKAKLIPKRVMDATYLINFAMLKAHSYPYNTMESGDEGQTAITMTGKNHFGSISGPFELHSILNTAKKGTKDAYSPLVDLAASPNLGGKTILYLLDGLYCGRKWKSYPIHFPNPPFNNRVEPYENSDWPASLLASFDGVALDSVGLDILNSQTKNNGDPINDNLPRILIRENADDYLVEMADPQHAPSKTNYVQGGKPVASLGTHEHWDGDATRRYSRNLDPANGKGIELIYVPIEAPKPEAMNAPATLPGKGLALHDFFYAGESKTERMFIVRGGKITWSYTHPAKGEISDAVLLSNGNVLFAHQDGVTEINANKQVVWNHNAPPNTEIHTAQPIGLDRVLFVQNGDPAKLFVINKITSKTECEFILPVKNPKNIHGHFRHARLTEGGTILIAHMDLRKVCEYDATGKELWSIDTPSGIWSATPLKNGNFLLTGGGSVREVNRAKDTVWQWTPADTPEYKMTSLQIATRLPNGNTVINNWFNEWSGKIDPANPPLQAIEVTPEKKVVWALRSWNTPVDLGSATTIQLLDDPSIPENTHLGDITGR